MSYRAAVITVSDRAFAGVYEDKSGPALCAMLREAGYEIAHTAIVPDEQERIPDALIRCLRARSPRSRRRCSMIASPSRRTPCSRARRRVHAALA